MIKRGHLKKNKDAIDLQVVEQYYHCVLVNEDEN